MSASNKPDRRDLEWRALQLLCAQIGAQNSRENSDFAALHTEDFADPLHLALFEEILRCAQRKMSATELRRWLPEQMTRRGWPDLDFADLFRSTLSEVTREQFLESVRALRAPTEISALSKSHVDPLPE
jgi:hypothetical protein